FTGDDVFKKIKVLSGGEKSRVALAKTLISEANFLMLDEPTNHLDMQSVNILIQALEQYEGTFIIISHDRYFVENVATKIWYIEDYQLKEYPGTYHEYETFMEKREKEAKQQAVTTTQAKQNQTKQPREKSEYTQLNNQLKQVNKQLSEVENQVQQLESKLAAHETELADPKVYGDVALLQEVTAKFEKVKSELDKAQEKWEELMLEIEDLETKLAE
ncbi:MAG: ATP-binding cassette domain-containing protein, partial [Hymenobacteraceae bacterium]|nr:ATP-binding cassette domain-containing protein [Hymenobacteraceae bacterium]